MAYTLTYELINNGTAYEVSSYTGEPIDVIIPSTYMGKPVTSIGTGAFDSCSSLTSVEIPDSVTSIGDYAFRNCDSLTYRGGQNDLLYLGNTQNPCLYLACVSIPGTTSITSAIINENCRFIGSDAFRNCSSLTSVIIPNSVTSIGKAAFALCGSLTSVVIPDSVTSISNGVFAACGSLTSVEIPDSVTSIGSYAFYTCRNLTSVVIPDSMTSIGSHAFSGCRSLTSITLLAKTPATIVNNTFEDIASEAKFYCYSSAIDSYKGAPNWKTYAGKFVADDIRLYFTMNSRAQKKYFASKEQVETLLVDMKSYIQQYIRDNFATLMTEYLN